jgi:hypothetical protein
MTDDERAERVKADEQLVAELRRHANDKRRSASNRADDNAAANQLQRRIREWRRSHAQLPANDRR